MELSSNLTRCVFSLPQCSGSALRFIPGPSGWNETPPTENVNISDFSSEVQIHSNVNKPLFYESWFCNVTSGKLSILPFLIKHRKDFDNPPYLNSRLILFPDPYSAQSRLLRSDWPVRDSSSPITSFSNQALCPITVWEGFQGFLNKPDFSHDFCMTHRYKMTTNKIAVHTNLTRFPNRSFIMNSFL